MRRPPERVMRGVWIASLFALTAAYVADQAGLEGIVSKRADSPYRSGPTTNWLKTKSFTVQEYELLGVEREPGKAAFALLAKPGTGKYAGSAFITLNQEMRTAVEACPRARRATAEGQKAAGDHGSGRAESPRQASTGRVRISPRLTAGFREE
ncbi:hypothetical protein [Mesorhizobium sp. M0898]|uniref:hypothetical protein n=1 Tax=Mesorhizobium sp. M0898 TaxID=2957020 RepID=UPI00333DDA69